MSTNEDRISNLPKELIASILGKIPIRDAVRTSVLAKKWRFYYLNVRELIFDDKFWKELGDFVLRKKSSNFHMLKFNQFDEIITKSLLVHPGGLEKFKVCVPYNGSTEPPIYVNKWILYLSSRNIKTLILKYNKVITQSYKLPTYFFSCLDLTFLKLHNVALSPPLGFKGFHNMCCLKLYGIDFTNNCFESFISGCPLLTSLVLYGCSGIRHFNIRSSKLKSLFIKANDQFESISLNGIPNLVEVSVALEGFAIGLEGNSVFNLDMFVGTLPKVKILRLNGKFLQLFTENLAMPIHRTSLKILEFKDVNFMDIDQISGVARLLRCAPNLQELYIEACTIILNEEQVSDYLRELHGRNFTNLHKLRLVKMMKIASFVPEFEFIRFLLFNSPSLVTMSIVEHPHLEAEKALDIARKLLQLRPPSGVCINLTRDSKRKRSYY